MHTLSDADFAAAAPPVELGDDEIHLWIFPQRGTGADARSDAQLRLRETLAAYLAADPAALRFARSATGKPHLADGALQFNLSHSGRALLIGLSRSQPLGVDIENGARARPYLAIARRYFTAGEASALAALRAERLRDGFLELWSAKEAVLKATGSGIGFGLDRIGFALNADGAVRGLAHVAEEAGSIAHWRIVRIALGSGMAGALAWHGRALAVRAFAGAGFAGAATIRPDPAS